MRRGGARLAGLGRGRGSIGGLYNPRLVSLTSNEMNSVRLTTKAARGVATAMKAATMAATLLLAAGSASAQAVKGDAAAGAGKVAMCIGCHGIPGYKASFPEIYRVPMISGQSAAYIVAALNGYKKGDRLHPSMRAIAVSLSDQDMADIAAYYEQHGRR